MRLLVGLLILIPMVAAAVGLVFLFSEDPSPPIVVPEEAPEADRPVGKVQEAAPDRPENVREVPRAPVQPTGPAADPLAPAVVSAFRDIPIEGARVFLQLSGNKTLRRSTDFHGQFQLPPGEGGLETIRVEADGFHSLEEDLEGEIEGKTFAMKPAATLQGRVTDSKGSPLDWVKIQVGVVIRDGTGALLGIPWRTPKRVVTQSGGGFKIVGLEPRGKYILAASLSRIGVNVVENLKPDIAPSASPVTIKLGGEASIRALIVNPEGKPVFGPRAALSGKPDGIPGEVVADENSRAVADIIRSFGVRFSRTSFSSETIFTGWKRGSGFVFDKLCSGDYVLQVQAKGFKTYRKRIRIGRHDQIDHEVKLEDEDVALTGVVADSGGRPIRGAQLNVLTDGKTYAGYRSASSGPDGSFRIRGPGEWLAPLTLTVAASGYESTTIKVPSDRKRVEVKLRRNSTVRGQVRLENKGSGEVEFNFVRSFPTSRHERRIFLMRDRWKRFTFTIPPGKWTLRVTAPGYNDYSGDLELLEGCEKSGLDIFLRLK